MTTLDDKLLGEKSHYYCSSSSEDEDDVDAPSSNGGVGHNTGPKGVIKDWQRYKQLESEKREEQKKELKGLAKKLTMGCRTDREDQEAKSREEMLEAEFDAMLSEEGEYLKDYMRSRMEEMIRANTSTASRFGTVIDLRSNDDFLNAIDKEEKNVLVLILVFQEGVPGCQAAQGCLGKIAKVYDHVKFCRISATTAGLSENFKDKGVPAVLAYKSGDQLTSLIRITDDLGEEFFAEDLQAFLVENSLLHDRSLLPLKIRGPANNDDSD